MENRRQCVAYIWSQLVSGARRHLIINNMPRQLEELKLLVAWGNDEANWLEEAEYA